MRVKAIMIPFAELKCISIQDTIAEALKIIDENRLLSMPVVDGKKFMGVLSKQYVYETFFKEYQGSREDYTAQQVKVLMKTTVPTIRKELPIEEAAALFIHSKVRFLPITNEENELKGIVTQQAIFKAYQKLFGNAYHTMVICTYDYKGVLAKISDITAKANGDIKNIVLVDTETLGLSEIHIRVDTDNFEGIVHALEKKGFDVRQP